MKVVDGYMILNFGNYYLKNHETPLRLLLHQIFTCLHSVGEYSGGVFTCYRNLLFDRTVYRAMVTLISHREPIARKDYRCMASDFLRDLGWDGLTFSDKRKVVIARRDKWMIRKGSRYVCQFQ
jgi:hypothetical protein